MYRINDILKEFRNIACEEEWQGVYAILHNKPWDEVVKHPKASEWVYWYAKEVLKAPWPEAEDIIKQSPQWACMYAQDVLQAIWPEAEDIIKQDLCWAC
jgi:hypothetical protein